MTGPKTWTPERRAKRCLKNHANRKLGSLLREFNYRCAWCEQEIVQLREVEVSSILMHNADVVKFLQEGTIIDCLLATTDHLVPISQGGRSNTENLVPACHECNNGRMQRDQAERFEERRLQLIESRKSREIVTTSLSNLI
jgi:5-methylcytosine-specific restriction endonuclease McrA